MEWGRGLGWAGLHIDLLLALFCLVSGVGGTFLLCRWFYSKRGYNRGWRRPFAGIFYFFTRHGGHKKNNNAKTIDFNP